MTEQRANAASLLAAVEANQKALNRLMERLLSPGVVASLAAERGAPVEPVDVGATVAGASAALRSLDAQLLHLRTTTQPARDSEG